MLTDSIVAMISGSTAAWGQLSSCRYQHPEHHNNTNKWVYFCCCPFVGALLQGSIWQALVGLLLFHTLFVVPQTGQALFGIPQIGEYFRVRSLWSHRGSVGTPFMANRSDKLQEKLQAANWP